MGYRFLATSILGWMAVTEGASEAAHSNLHSNTSKEDREGCPRCDEIFSMVETTSSGELVQQIDMQERGEPKSGTALMYHGTQGALAHTCDFLNKWFGSDSCHLEGEHYKGRHHTPPHIGLNFFPRQGETDALCPCHGVDRVTLRILADGKPVPQYIDGRVQIRVSSKDKHKLPVHATCKWYHNNGIAKYYEGCWSVGDRPVETFDDIRLCMVEANCDIYDKRLQFAILRDPRAEAVSTFLYVQQHARAMRDNGTVGFGLNTVDEFVLKTLPIIAHWVSLRYILFAEMLSRQSTIYWYTDALGDVFEWHQEWLASVGLHLPPAVVEGMADVDLSGEFNFDTTEKDANLVGDAEQVNGSVPSWRDGLRPETVEKMDRIVQQWLPPVILNKIGAQKDASAE